MILLSDYFFLDKNERCQTNSLSFSGKGFFFRNRIFFVRFLQFNGYPLWKTITLQSRRESMMTIDRKTLSTGFKLKFRNFNLFSISNDGGWKCDGNRIWINDDEKDVCWLHSLSAASERDNVYEMNDEIVSRKCQGRWRAFSPKLFRPRHHFFYSFTSHSHILLDNNVWEECMRCDNKKTSTSSTSALKINFRIPDMAVKMQFIIWRLLRKAEVE